MIDELATRRLKGVFYIQGCCHIGYAQRTATQVWGELQGVLRGEKREFKPMITSSALYLQGSVVQVYSSSSPWKRGKELYEALFLPLVKIIKR